MPDEHIQEPHERFAAVDGEPYGGAALEYAVWLEQQRYGAPLTGLKLEPATTWRQPYWLIGEDADVRSRALRPGR